MKKRIIAIIARIVISCTSCRSQDREINTDQAQRKLWNAVIDRNLEEIQKAAADVHDINDLSLNGTWWNPIFLNLENEKDFQVIECLLDCGVSVNSADEDGHTILMCVTELAFGFPDHDLMNLFLERGADVNIRDNAGYTALDYVVQGFFDDTDSFNALLHYGAQVNEETFSLAFYGMPENAEMDKLYGIQYRQYQYLFLERLGQELRIKGMHPNIPEILEAAIVHDNEQFLSYYTDEWQQLTEEEKRVAFFFTAYSGTAETFYLLLQDPILDLDLVDGSQHSLLEVAAMGGNTGILTFLLSEKTWNEDVLLSATMLALDSEKSDALQILLDHGAIKFDEDSIQAFDDADYRMQIKSWMETPVKTGNQNMIRQLLDAGYPINEVTVWEIMKIAAQYGQLSIIQDFTDMGYSIDDSKFASQFKEPTILYMACRYGQLEVVQWLVEAGANPGQEVDCLWEATGQNNLELCTFLVEHGADPYASWGKPSWDNLEQFTAIYVAEQYGYTEIIELFTSVKSKTT